MSNIKEVDKAAQESANVVYIQRLEQMVGSQSIIIAKLETNIAILQQQIPQEEDAE